MFGKNPVRHNQRTDGSILWVQELFYSLQGEGPFIGRPAVFVRLSGCNLRCFWCDTDFESARRQVAVPQLLAEIEKLRPPHCSLIVLTGGEPLLQNIAPLAENIIRRGLTLQIETNGTIWQDLPKSSKCVVICSPKTPKIDGKIAVRADYFKYVLTEADRDSPDGLPIMSTQTKGKAEKLYRPRGLPPSRIYITPCDEGDSADERGAKLRARQGADEKAADERAASMNERERMRLGAEKESEIRRSNKADERKLACARQGASEKAADERTAPMNEREYMPMSEGIVPSETRHRDINTDEQQPACARQDAEKASEAGGAAAALGNLPLVAETALKFGYCAGIQLHKLAKIP